MSDRPPPRMGPGRRAVYRPDNSRATGFGGFILSQPVRDAVAEIAGEIARGAAGASARGEGEDGHMADKWKVEKDAGIAVVRSGGHANPRVRVDVHNPDIAAAAQEFGFRGHKRRHALRQVAAAFGDFHDHGEGES